MEVLNNYDHTSQELAKEKLCSDVANGSLPYAVLFISNPTRLDGIERKLSLPRFERKIMMMLNPQTMEHEKCIFISLKTDTGKTITA